jgi:hypothetical protein
MTTSLDSFLVHPFLSLLESIFLSFGLGYIGYLITRVLLNEEWTKKTWIQFNYPVIGATVIIILLTPFAAFGFVNKKYFTIVAYFLLILGIVFLKISFKFLTLKIQTTVANSNNLLEFFLIIGFLFLSMSAITNADSLDYHIGAAIEILNTGGFPNRQEWFHGNLAGNGEVLIALGLSIGAEQFASMLQFLGLLGISSILAFFKGLEEHELPSFVRKTLVLSFLSSPVLIFLVSSAKPQLLPIAMNFLALICFLNFSKKEKNFNIYGVYIFIISLCMTASQSKMSFLMSSGLILVFIFFNNINLRNFLYVFWMSIALGLIIIFPMYYKKYLLFNHISAEFFLSPIPSYLPGSLQFQSFLKSYTDSSIFFPLSLIVPISMGSYTTTLGFSLFIILFIKLKYRRTIVGLYILAFSIFILGVFFGQKTSRFFLEPFLILLLSFLYISSKSNFNFKAFIFFRKVIKIQSLLSLLFISSGIVFLFPGSFSRTLREGIMTKYANGYHVMQWVDQKLPSDAELISGHRSIALVPRKAYSKDWFAYANDLKSQKFYFQNMIQNGATHVLHIGSNVEEHTLFACSKGKLHKTETFIASRNPFNQTTEMDAYLFELDKSKINLCL